MSLAKAIQKLRPNTDFVIYENDLEQLTFVNPTDVKKPTKAEVDKALKEIEAEEATKADKLATDKASGLAKLAALGLTNDEAIAILGS
jgi:rRNA processing protein Krr1/Pno1